jgi:excisionase family DNA binding protein
MGGIMTGPAVTRVEDLPYLLTANEVATLLRTTLKAVYADVARNRLPGVVRHGRRLLFKRDELLRSLGEKRAPSPGGSRR